MRGFVIALGLVACQPTVVISPSVPASARSVLIVSTDDGSVTAADLTTPMQSAILPGPGPVEVLSFACSVDRLGLLPGAQALVPTAVDRGLLPDGIGVHASDDPSGGEWRDTPAPSAGAESLLRRLPVPRENRCIASRAVFQGTVLELPVEAGEPRFAFRVDDRRAVIGTYGVAFMVDRDGRVERLDYGGRHLKAGFRRGDVYWFVDATTSLLKGPIEGPLEVVTATVPLPDDPDLLAMTGSPIDAPFEVYLTASDAKDAGRGFARFDGERWASLGEATRGGRFLPAVAWIAPGEAVAIGVDRDASNAVVRYIDGAARSELLPGEIDGPTSIAHLPSLGTFVGRDNGELDRYERGAWVDTGLGQARFFTRAIAPIEGGLIYGTATEQNFLGYRFAQYYPDLGVCPLERLTELAAIHLVALDDDVIIASTVGTFGGATSIVRLDRVAGPRDCGPGAKTPIDR